VRRISVIEHERLRLGRVTAKGTDGSILSKVDFDRLRDFDEKTARSRGATIFAWTAKEAKARQWVGVVEVKGLSIEILPKIAGHIDDAEFARHNLLYMLSVATRVPIRERDLASQSDAKLPLLEALIRTFCKRLLHEIQVGLPHNYIGREENLPLVKGKLKISQHLKLNSIRPDRFFVAHEEFSADNLMNRVLRACCQKLTKVARLPKTRELLRQALMLMDDVADVTVTEVDFDHIHITRQNQRFESLVDFARLVLLNDSPTSVVGSVNTFSLLFDMNAVFESFIAEFLNKYVVGRAPFEGWRVREQGRGISPRYLAKRQSDGLGVSKMMPDITLTKRGQQSIIIDTKWKSLGDQSDGRMGASKADFLQLYAYAHHYECRHVVLLYPRIPGGLEESFDIISGTDRTVHMRFVDMTQDLKANRRELAKQLQFVVGELVCIELV
jgi:5-methylcytosine-specific restriction enzyme subunit McrC